MCIADAPHPIGADEANALFAGLQDTRALVLAVSGGPDSTALLLLAARWRTRLSAGPTLVAVTVDHGLRPEAADEARQMERLAKTLGVAHRTLRWSDPKPRTGLQQAARDARYRLLHDLAVAVGADHILTAHTRDDQAETVLIRMSRGSGISGLAGMARMAPLPGVSERSVTVLRPFLGIDKARLIATLEDGEIGYAEDPSNRDPRFTRSRIRTLAPGLAGEGLDSRRLAQLADRLRRADQALTATAEAAWQACISLSGQQRIASAPAFAELPAEIGLRLLGRAIAEVGSEGPVELGKLEKLYDALAAALASRQPLRRTLAGALVTLTGKRLLIAPAPARRPTADRDTKALNHRLPSLTFLGRSALG